MYLFAGENDVHNISGQLVINDEFLVLYGLSCTIYFHFFFLWVCSNLVFYGLSCTIYFHFCFLWVCSNSLNFKPKNDWKLATNFQCYENNKNFTNVSCYFKWSVYSKHLSFSRKKQLKWFELFWTFTKLGLRSFVVLFSPTNFTPGSASKKHWLYWFSKHL